MGNIGETGVVVNWWEEGVFAPFFQHIAEFGPILTMAPECLEIGNVSEFRAWLPYGVLEMFDQLFVVIIVLFEYFGVVFGGSWGYFELEQVMCWGGL